MLATSVPISPCEKTAPSCIPNLPGYPPSAVLSAGRRLLCIVPTIHSTQRRLGGVEAVSRTPHTLGGPKRSFPPQTRPPTGSAHAPPPPPRPPATPPHA